MDHDYMKFWIQIHGIPLKHINKETGRVGINIKKPLPTGFFMDRENQPPLWIFFKYERLLECYYFNCGIIGHERKTCKNPTTMACWDQTKPKYSAGLGVNQVRSLLAIEIGSSGQRSKKNGDEEEQARANQNMGRDSEEEQETEESVIRADLNMQQELRENEKNEVGEQGLEAEHNEIKDIIWLNTPNEEVGKESGYWAFSK
ncbi:hypothetical protein Ahy_B08g094127 [Arachis hypogaea]|uniref:Zinc knuckle CX2CX4HX4C domain-containing protein n=1 Tax=Arachis hypogaea TaxID=3818 RepID=A0A444Y7Y5_ARAHY|nr:hypothetical protein Ahy_B08g094127 [Arachis hypogaea]